MPIITLSTDIGNNDYITGAIKGQLLSAMPSVTIADITHNLSSDNFLQAAYICSNAAKYYPEGTVHFIVANLFQQAPARLLVTLFNGQYFICADNGLLTMITRVKPQHVYAIPVNAASSLHVLQCTQAVAKVLPALFQHGVDALGSPVTNLVEKYPLRSTATANQLESQIIFIDNFENVVINITRDEFEEYRKGRAFKIYLTRNEMIDTISQCYASVPQGNTLAWFNAAGYLELAINKGNLAGFFGLQGFSEKTQHAAAIQNKLLYQVVRIYFE
ncbi:SAM hydrolase/SAM-dependent halogenase family protein [Foetidibacter luteolus]|uniref:SAM hydrolase/SAM-dependent halogenase family protein n=1 Tax=Foetidibacter luteolus TaxID=2608880 RepID=UPI00129A5D44|nr:SAM-dependent chlorinase/fluorinase [Foetidibacter luteolus]